MREGFKVRRVLALATALSTSFLPALAEAASQDDEVTALRREMREMQRQMRDEIRVLQARIARDEGRTVSVTTGHGGEKVPRVVHAHRWAGGPLPAIGEPQGPAATHRPRTDAETRLITPEGPIPSWAEIRAATARDETVHVGGMQIGFPSGRPTISSDDGAYSFSIGLTAQEDLGGFLGAGPKQGEGAGNFNKFTQNARRLRIYFSWRYKDWVANVTPEFGSSSVDGSVSLFEANANYTGLRHTTLTVGYFQPRMEEESAERASSFEFLERPTIIDLVRNLAGGVARFSVGGEHYENRWQAAAYFTGQKFGDRSKDTTITDSQTGAVARIVGRPYVTKDIDVHVGAGATSAFKVNQNSSGRNYMFSDNMEVPLGETSLLTSGALTNVSQIWAAGPQLAFRWRKFLLKGEYYHVGVERGHNAGASPLPSLNFDGWYVAANYTLLGRGRGYNVKTGAFTTPGVEHDFDPARGDWGALELSGRWSVADLSDVANQGGVGVNGNQQTVWAGGLNWYPNQHFKFMLDFDHFIVTRSKGVSGGVDLLGRTGNAVAGRVQATF
ncbi:OprO/OprP family phosphate-selective porin [Gluconacetobacter asukensis]|uniref:Porin n=1 Tax=Gluconacetobacter asukensis TaxID=1017181 RepID=A0A7W4J242_9PROT|nr:porin [Gluconacetobacter asukensis]MBB2173290.1 porin [Gluconacetobacter asukensis]